MPFTFWVCGAENFSQKEVNLESSLKYLEKLKITKFVVLAQTKKRIFFEILSDLNQAVPSHLADESQTR